MKVQISLVIDDAYLKRVDWVDLGDDHPAAETPERLGAALANVTITRHARNLRVKLGIKKLCFMLPDRRLRPAHLSREHDVCGALDSVHQGLSAAIQVVEL